MIRSKAIDNGIGKFSTKQAILVALNYFVGYTAIYATVAVAISHLIFNVADGVAPLASFMWHLFTIVTMILIIWKPLLSAWRQFTANGNLASNLIEVFKNFGLLYLVNIVVNMIILLVMGEGAQSGNQAAVEAMINIDTLAMGFMVVIFAPLVEEFVFRGVFYQYFRSAHSYIIPMIVSILSFGLIHVIPTVLSSGNISEFIYLLQYCPMAFFMIRTMESTDSLFGAISVHFLNNLLGFLAIVFLA